MTTIVIASCKGGVGKTTTAVSLASALSNLDPVLLADGDPQSHVTLSFGLPVRSGLFDWLVRGLPLSDCTLTGRPDALTILPGDSLTKTVERLYGDSTEFARLVEKLRLLAADCRQWTRSGQQSAVSSQQSCFVVIDTAAGGLFQEAALAAADQVVVPFRAEALGIDSLFQTMELIRQLSPQASVTSRSAPGAPIILLPTAFDMRLKEQKENLQMVVNEFGADYGLERDWDRCVIRARTAVSEATSYGRTVWEYNASGIKDVRRGYSLLVNRVMASAGLEMVDKEGKVQSGTGN